MAAAGSSSSSTASAPSGVRVSVGLAVAGAGAAATYLAIRAAQQSLRAGVRKGASSPFECQVALHGPEKGRHSLVKVPKTGDADALRAAVAEALGVEPAELQGAKLFPVLRRRGGGGRLGERLEETGTVAVARLEAILESRPADQLQLAELVITLDGSEPPTVPPAPPSFPVPGIPSLPFLGHMYVAKGKSEIPAHNIVDWIFPPSASEYPTGATVRLYNGGKHESIVNFPDGAIFHIDAETYTTFTADPCVVEELLARSGEFPKLWNRPAQVKLQDFTGNGLFTSGEWSEDWQSAHSILPRGFNQIKVKHFAPQILAKTRAFVQQWSAFPSGHTVEDVNHWLTAMTADAVVLCSMGLDMRSVERMGSGAEPHPFIDSFRFGLGRATGTITPKSEFGFQRFRPGFDADGKIQKRYQEAKKTLEEMIGQMVEQTRAGDLGGPDSIIRAMLQEKAPNGKYVRYNNLYAQVINIMIAGHETTAATLGFTLHFIASHPEVEAKAVEEVRRVLQGRTEPTVDDVPKLVYIEQCFREALRLYSPVTAVDRDVAYDTLLQGRRVYQGEKVNVLTRALHTNPEHWGGEFGDPLSYNPDRFSPEAVQRRHPNAYHPWGFGQRSCIGSQFALFEAKTFLVSMLIHFKILPVPGYELTASRAAGGAAPSPHELKLIIRPRPGGPLYGRSGDMLRLQPSASSASPKASKAAPVSPMAGSASPRAAAEGGVPMLILYGSNAGSSQEFAAQASKAARKAGFAVAMSTLDKAVEGSTLRPDEGQLVVIITSTYNGHPPDNAAKFKKWLNDKKDGSLGCLRFTVFGVGNSQWQTYQQFPREVDSGLERCGASRVHKLGCCDVDAASFDTDFDDWLASLIVAVGGAAAGGAGDDEDFEIDMVEATKEFRLVSDVPGTAEGSVNTDIRSALTNMFAKRTKVAKELGESLEKQMSMLEVVEPSRELCQQPEGRSVRHVTLRLPEDHRPYRAGDHLEVLPKNDAQAVDMALAVLGLGGSEPVLWDFGKSSVASNRSARDSDQGSTKRKMGTFQITARLALEWIPNLAVVPSRKTISALARFAKGEAKQKLKDLASSAELYKAEVVTPQISFIELVQLHQEHIKISIGELFVVAKPLAPRYYSVSSSPAGRKDPRLVTVSVGQVVFKTGTGRTHKGLASTMLGDMKVGDVVAGSVRSLTGNFHVPADPSAPMIMVGPGTGLAPMMGFLEERQHLLNQGVTLGPALLFFGCQKRDKDYLYRDELADFLKSGALTELHVAFSREGPQKVYVQDIILEQRSKVWKLLQDPKACIFVCGDARAMAPDVRRAFQRVAVQSGGRSEASAAGLIASMVEGDRYLEDVWAN